MSRQGVQWLRSGLNTLITLTSGGASTPTSAFSAQTYHIRVAAGPAPAFVRIGDGTPVADSTGGSMLIGANSQDYFVVTPGQKAAALSDGGATPTKVTVTEMS